MDIDNLIKDLTGKSVLALPEQTEMWAEWYAGDVKDFHQYKDYNGIKEVSCVRRTLNMGKKVCEDWANLLLNEKTQVTYGDGEAQEQFDKLLSSVNFWQRGNMGIEKTFALGNGAFVESFDNKKQARFQFVQAKKIKPLNIEQDRITECAFVNDNTYETIIQIHMRGYVQDNKFYEDLDKNYCVRTVVYKKTTPNSDQLGDKIKDETIDTGSDRAWFQMFKPNIANNIKIDSPLGISVLANALDTLQGVDLAYDGFCEEMRLGKGKIFINKQLTTFDEKGEHLIFDVNQTGFYYLGDGSDKQPVTFYNPQLRVDQYFNGVNNGLNILSSKVGFGENHYRFNQIGLSTATQVMSEQNEKFKTKKKHEILLNEVIVDACRALMYISNSFTDNGYTFDVDADIGVVFDDSIIEDKATEMLNDRQDVASGIMSKVEYRMKWYGEDEDTAKKAINEISKNAPMFFSEE